ncbi:MAG: hypothetical protein KC646_14175 [Candidatus Cloacimonetes bacterium]|nr:hypothetical protein [Candidatus Cloacimonadota bacterium]
MLKKSLKRSFILFAVCGALVQNSVFADGDDDKSTTAPLLGPVAPDTSPDIDITKGPDWLFNNNSNDSTSTWLTDQDGRYVYVDGKPVLNNGRFEVTPIGGGQYTITDNEKQMSLIPSRISSKAETPPLVLLPYSGDDTSSNDFFNTSSTGTGTSSFDFGSQDPETTSPLDRQKCSEAGSTGGSVPVGSAGSAGCVQSFIEASEDAGRTTNAMAGCSDPNFIGPPSPQCVESQNALVPDIEESSVTDSISSFTEDDESDDTDVDTTDSDKSNSDSEDDKEDTPVPLEEVEVESTKSIQEQLAEMDPAERKAFLAANPEVASMLKAEKDGEESDNESDDENNDDKSDADDTNSDDGISDSTLEITSSSDSTENSDDSENSNKSTDDESNDDESDEDDSEEDENEDSDDSDKGDFFDGDFDPEESDEDDADEFENTSRQDNDVDDIFGDPNEIDFDSDDTTGLPNPETALEVTNLEQSAKKPKTGVSAVDEDTGEVLEEEEIELSSALADAQSQIDAEEFVETGSITKIKKNGQEMGTSISNKEDSNKDTLVNETNMSVSEIMERYEHIYQDEAVLRNKINRCKQLKSVQKKKVSIAECIREDIDAFGGLLIQE